MMSLVDRASARYLIRRPWQLVLALLGICIGVAVVVAVDLANQGSRAAFLQSMSTVNGASTHQIIGGSAGLDEQFYTELRVQGGVREIAPVVSGYADVASARLHVLGIDFFAESGIRDFSAAENSTGVVTDASGTESTETLLRRLLTEPGAVMLTANTAAALDISVGDRFAIDANGRSRSAILVGLIPQNAEGSPGLDELMLADIGTAQEWIGRRGKLTRIDVVAEGERAGEVLAGIRARLPAGAQLLNADGRTQTTLEMSAAFNTNLTAMSLLALLVGIFLIYNSVGFTVLQRRQLIGTLRALGVTREEMLTLVLREALLLGVLGSVMGIVLGTWLGDHLLQLVSRSINDLYFRVSATDVSLQTVTLTKGLAAGILATLLAAAVPAVEAAGYRPRLAMLRSTLEMRSGRLASWVAGTGVLAAIASIPVVALSTDSLVAGLVALFMLVMGIALCIPALMRLASRRLGSMAQRTGGIAAQLAVSGVTASLSRTAVAVVALAVAISATVGVGTMVGSFRLSVQSWLDDTLQSDVYVSAPGGVVDSDLAAELVGLPGVVQHSTARRVSVESSAGQTRLIAVETTPQSRSSMHLIEGDGTDAWQAFDNGAVLVSEPYAWRHDLAVGDLLPLQTDQGEKSFEVAAVYRSYDAGQGFVLMGLETFREYWNDPGIGSIGLYLDADVAPSSVIAEVRALGVGRQSLLARSNREIREISLRIFDQTFIITNVLYWLALIVAVIGILGAMLAMQMERARELATLRALGMTRRQIAVLILSQTGFIGTLSGIAALPLGVLMAWMLIRVINLRSFGWQLDIVVAPLTLGVAVAVAVLAALVAGIYPAYRASTLEPARAMREE